MPSSLLYFLISYIILNTKADVSFSDFTVEPPWTWYASAAYSCWCICLHGLHMFYTVFGHINILLLCIFFKPHTILCRRPKSISLIAELQWFGWIHRSFMISKRKFMFIESCFILLVFFNVFSKRMLKLLIVSPFEPI